MREGEVCERERRDQHRGKISGDGHGWIDEELEIKSHFRTRVDLMHKFLNVTLSPRHAVHDR